MSALRKASLVCGDLPMRSPQRGFCISNYEREGVKAFLLREFECGILTSQQSDRRVTQVTEQTN